MLISRNHSSRPCGQLPDFMSSRCRSQSCCAPDRAANRGRHALRCTGVPLQISLQGTHTGQRPSATVCRAIAAPAGKACGTAREIKQILESHSDRNDFLDIQGGFPHSEIHGSKLIRSSPRLIAAYHVLHRLCMPRHPPIALLSLDHSHCQCSSIFAGLANLVLFACAQRGAKHDQDKPSRVTSGHFPQTTVTFYNCGAS